MSSRQKWTIVPPDGVLLQDLLYILSQDGWICGEGEIILNGKTHACAIVYVQGSLKKASLNKAT